jgi:predicted dehydrogenase
MLIQCRPMALINPAKSHPEVIVQAVAARDRKRAEAYAKKHGIHEVKGSYQGTSLRHLQTCLRDTRY